MDKYIKEIGYSYINGIFKDKDCQHCGDEWEYQCEECEKTAEEVGVESWIDN